MRILVATAHLGVGGAETLLLQLVRGLDRSRFDVTVCALVSGGVLTPSFRELGIRVHELGVVAGAGELRGVGLFALVARSRPDLIHARLILPSLWARLARPFGIRVITDELGLAEDRPPLITWINRATQPLCDLTIANSKAVAARVRERDGVPGSRLRVIYNGIDVARFSGIAPRSTPTYDLISVARLERYKGIFDLVDAMERIVSRRPGTTLAMVGDGAGRVALERRIAERGLGSSIRLLGRRMDIADLLPLARVFVLASHEEGFPVAIVEAMAAGLPVVATAVGGNPEAVSTGRTGSLVPPRDPAALADAILVYLADPGLVRSHGAAGRTVALERFDLGRMIRDYEEVYESIRHPRASRQS